MNENENNDTVLTMVDGSSSSGGDSDAGEDLSGNSDDGGDGEDGGNGEDGDGGGNGEDGGGDDGDGEGGGDEDYVDRGEALATETVFETEINSQPPKGKGKYVPKNKNNFKGNHNQQNRNDNKGKGNYKGFSKNTNNTGNQHSVKNFNSKSDNSKDSRNNSSSNNSNTNNASHSQGNYNKSRFQNSGQNPNQKQSTSANYKNNNQSTPANHYNKNHSNNNSGNTSKNYNNQHNNSSNKNNSGNHNSNINKNNCIKKDGGGEKVDIFKQVKSIISIYMKNNEVCQAPIDSLVLKFHYRMGVCLLLLTFSMIQFNWFLRESIHCVYNFNAKEDVSSAIKNICLSYPFVCEEDMTLTDDRSDCPRRYILFYRWLHYSILLLAGAYYIPRMIAKKAENPRLKKLIIDLAQGERRYDGSTWEQDTETMLNYMHSHISTHKMLYLWLVMCHVVALVIDIAAFLFLDFVLQGYFLGLVYSAYPFHRDPKYLKDELSRTFPPFVYCKLDASVIINNAREDVLGCHLMLMELYEKVFIILWICLAVVTICTAISVFFLLLITLPPFNRLFLCMHSSSKEISNLKKKVLKFCGCADLYVLYLFKRHRSEAQFIMFLTRFVHNTDDKIQVGNEHGNLSNLKEKQENTENALDPSNMKREKGLNKNHIPPFHQLPPNLQNYCDFSSPINTSFKTGFSKQDQIRSRKFDASSPNPKFPPQFGGIEECEDQYPNVEVA